MRGIRNHKRYSIAVAYKDDHCQLIQTDDLPTALRALAILYEDHPGFACGHIMDNKTGRCPVMIDKNKGD